MEGKQISVECQRCQYHNHFLNSSYTTILKYYGNNNDMPICPDCKFPMIMAVNPILLARFSWGFEHNTEIIPIKDEYDK